MFDNNENNNNNDDGQNEEGNGDNVQEGIRFRNRLARNLVHKVE